MNKSMNEIKGRLESVRKTRKITNAMYLLSTARLRKDLTSADYRSEYLQKLREALAALLASPDAKKLKSPLTAKKEGLPALYLVVTGDRGLCGSYNTDLVAYAAAAAAETKKSSGQDSLLYGFGKMSADCMRRAGITPDKILQGAASHPDAATASTVTDELIKAFTENKAGQVFIVCSPYKRGASKPMCIPFLPLDLKEMNGTDKTEEKVVFEPDIASAFEAAAHAYCQGTVYSLLVLSALSENSARSEAMREATDNADEMAQALEAEMNAARQLSITNEITEIAAAAESLK